MNPEQQTSSPIDTNPSPPYSDSSSSSLAIIGIVLGWVLSPVGLVISIMAYKRSKRARQSTVLALIGIIVGGVFTGLILVMLAALLLQ